jgi:hypothetical protein
MALGNLKALVPRASNIPSCHNYLIMPLYINNYYFSFALYFLIAVHIIIHIKHIFLKERQNNPTCQLANVIGLQENQRNHFVCETLKN